MLVSRRAFLYGTAAAGAMAAVGLGLSGCGAITGGSDEVTYLEVPESSLVTLNDFEALDSPEGKIQLVGSFDIPYGTLVWANDDEVAACLLPTSSGSPLTQVGLLFFSSGSLNVVLDRAVGAAEHFEVYDVRATVNGLVWTEANVLQGIWRVYTARIANGGIEGAPVLVEEGDATYDTPMLAVSSKLAFWQVVPKAPNDAGLPSRLMAAAFGIDKTECVYENARRMGTPPYSDVDSITIAPRLDMSTVYYQLTNIDAQSGKVTDSLTLPGGMSPLETGYGKTGFMLSFADIYNYGDGISNLGTYTPVRKPSDGNYSNVKWFGFARTPTAAPAWCGNLLVVKSSYSVCGVDLEAGTYFAIDVDNGADDYGEYLASSGTHGNFVTYANIDHHPIGADAVHACRVKIWNVLT
ncbi:MAG: twin-arginine translocation signal domain-containing protein [Eggerthellaceae bacterium]|nr:twin-arginine translocation signal domain-containing protein [Eggerthellaceae bacterium]